MYNGGNTDGYGGAIQTHGGSRYSPYGNNATQNHLQAKDMVSFQYCFTNKLPVRKVPIPEPHKPIQARLITCLPFKGFKVC